jgi:hypothetical protein
MKFNKISLFKMNEKLCWLAAPLKLGKSCEENLSKYFKWKKTLSKICVHNACQNF